MGWKGLCFADHQLVKAGGYQGTSGQGQGTNPPPLYPSVLVSPCRALHSPTQGVEDKRAVHAAHEVASRADSRRGGHGAGAPRETQAQTRT